MDNAINIRKAQSKDSKNIACLLLSAMEDIIYDFIGESAYDKAINFLEHFIKLENNQYSYQNCWVMSIDEEIIAAINIYNGAELKKLRRPIENYLKNELNQIFDMEEETKEGEFYIDSLGVRPDKQGQGYARILLQKIIQIYSDKSPYCLGLLVEKRKAHAKKLYLSMGFKYQKDLLLAGIEMEHLQLKQRTI
ncbi:MAG: GNAT family N-acetyltransferase [Marinifilaceae bacterium]|jgi:ribosomal protein S18 acetylase RimI-like enzyme|nr:GNAT family N-acetyltransferase [Marinifilaceae bacterium]